MEILSGGLCYRGCTCDCVGLCWAETSYKEEVSGGLRGEGGGGGFRHEGGFGQAGDKSKALALPLFQQGFPMSDCAFGTWVGTQR